MEIITDEEKEILIKCFKRIEKRVAQYILDYLGSDIKAPEKVKVLKEKYGIDV